MAIKNREKLIQTIKEDCLIAQNYLRDGQTCAIGGLAKAAGFDLYGFFMGMIDQSRYFANQDFISSETVKPMADAITLEFGLDINQQFEIQHTNDLYETPEERQEAILEYIATL